MRVAPFDSASAIGCRSRKSWSPQAVVALPCSSRALALLQSCEPTVTLQSQCASFRPSGADELISGTSTAVFRGHSSNCRRSEGQPVVVRAMPVSGQRYSLVLTSTSAVPLVDAIQSPPSLVGFCQTKRSALSREASQRPGNCTGPVRRVAFGGCSCPGRTCRDLKAKAGAQKPGFSRDMTSVSWPQLPSAASAEPCSSAASSPLSASLARP
mmetsp:Transcript_96732/g.312352  ORF Transcript_96732/g.312352 Transcript_96732/m.312352 type:complete len:212 (-) Transcript_96732:31-666(-)